MCSGKIIYTKKHLIHFDNKWMNKRTNVFAGWLAGWLYPVVTHLIIEHLRKQPLIVCKMQDMPGSQKTFEI